MTDQNYRILEPWELKKPGDEWANTGDEDWTPIPPNGFLFPPSTKVFKFRRPIPPVAKHEAHCPPLCPQCLKLHHESETCPPVAKSATTEPVKESLTTGTEIERLKKEKDGIFLILEAVTENCLAMKLRAEKAEAELGDAQEAIRILSAGTVKLQTAERERDDYKASVGDLAKTCSELIKERDALRADRDNWAARYGELHHQLKIDIVEIRQENTRLREALEKISETFGFENTQNIALAALAGKEECSHDSVNSGNHPDEGFIAICNKCGKEL